MLVPLYTIPYQCFSNYIVWSMLVSLFLLDSCFAGLAVVVPAHSVTHPNTGNKLVKWHGVSFMHYTLSKAPTCPYICFADHVQSKLSTSPGQDLRAVHRAWKRGPLDPDQREWRCDQVKLDCGFSHARHIRRNGVQDLKRC